MGVATAVRGCCPTNHRKLNIRHLCDGLWRLTVEFHRVVLCIYVVCGGVVGWGVSKVLISCM